MSADGSLVRSQLPLRDVVMCCTSIPPERRSGLAAIASQMGARHNLDLTSDVTHLIVGDLDTPKYKFVAKERPDVKCLLPEWVEAVRQSWMEGGETDIEALELEFRLPTFSGLRISFTGFEDLTTRKELETLIKENGAEYRGVLTKEVTHLIASDPTSKKYRYAKTRGMHVVSIEWLQQSVERGMVLEESLYDPLLDVADRGRNAWTRKPASSSSLVKRTNEVDGEGAPPRKLRRTASVKLNNGSDGIWTDIVAGGSGGEEAAKEKWDESQGILLPHVKDEVAVSEVPERIGLGSPSGGKARSPVFTGRSGVSVSKPVAKRGLFHGKRFFLHGFDARKTAILEQHLQSQDAEILPKIFTSTASDVTFVLVPHTFSEGEIPSTSDSRSPIVVTDLYVEKCLHSKQYLEPKASILHEPFRFPIQGFDGLTVSSTAFEGVELLHVSKAVNLLGGTYDEYLSSKTSVLICNDHSLTRQKIKHALEWNVPAVKSDWLWDCMRSSQLKPFDDYFVHPHLQSQIASRNETPNKLCHKPLAAVEEQLSRISSKRIGPIRVDRKRSPAGDSAFEEQGDMTITIPAMNTVKSPQMLPGRSTPLQEVSPNPSPQRCPSPPKPAGSAPARSNNQLESNSLTSVISSFLARRHSREGATASARVPPATKRKRQLFGRAISNLSAQDHPGFSLSRASSVDTVNTDGVGTPLDHPPMPQSVDKEQDTLTAELLETYDEHAEEVASNYMPAMTQVGYEDPEAGMWRARLVRKMGGRDPSIGEAGDTPKKKPVVRDMGNESVSRRTRHKTVR